MKALFCLALFLAVSSSLAYFPSFHPLKIEGSTLEVNSVFAQANPQPGKINTLTICATALSQIEVRSYFYLIGEGSKHWTSGSSYVNAENVFKGDNYCMLFKYVVPSQVVDTYSVNVTFSGKVAILGGAQIDFKL